MIVCFKTVAPAKVTIQRPGDPEINLGKMCVNTGLHTIWACCLAVNNKSWTTWQIMIFNTAITQCEDYRRKTRTETRLNFKPSLLQQRAFNI